MNSPLSAQTLKKNNNIIHREYLFIFNITCDGIVLKVRYETP